MQPKIYTDGIVDFSGGMDSYTSPSFLQKNQYAYAVNCRLKTGKRGIHTREGYREVKLNFDSKKDEQLFRCSDIQGCGAYAYLGKILQFVSCSGRLFMLTEVSKFEYNVSLLRFNIFPTARNVYFSSVPNGLIINDGVSKPIYADGISLRRAKKDEIGAGFGGAYIQRRFYWIEQDRKRIGVSSLNNPLSLEEPRLNNIEGFYTPDEKLITAIGQQKYISKDTSGGSLVFSTEGNIFSANVAGKLSEIGPASGDVYDVSAVSQNSFLSMNGNLFFRSKTLDVISLQYLEYVFNNQDITEQQSYGGKLFFDQDYKDFLDSCYSVKYNNRIFTTLSPNLLNHSIFWDGMIVIKPSEKGLLTYESIYTGIRPWCMQTIENNMYVFSYDYDCTNRLYILDDSIDYDLNIGDKPKDIESKLFTRDYTFSDPFSQKKTVSQFYTLAGLSKEVSLEILSKINGSDSLRKIYSTKHLARKRIFNDRFINASADVIKPNVSFSDSLETFITKQDIIKIKGPFSLVSLIRQASSHNIDNTIKPQEKTSTELDLSVEKVYTYKTKEK